MKLFISILTILFIGVWGCNQPKPQGLAAKKAELTKYQDEIGRLQDLSAKLEAEIAEEDTSSSNEIVRVVSVEEARIQRFSHFIDLRGTVESENTVQVTAGMPGLITRVLVVEGQKVNKGQLLAETEAAAMKESISQIEANLQLAKTAFERQKNLWDQKIGSELQYLQAKTNYESLEKQLSGTQAQFKLSKVYAPISGTIDEVYAKVGMAASPGLPVVTIVNLGDLEAVAQVPENYLGAVKMGLPVKVVLTELKDTLNTKINKVSLTVNPMTRTFKIQCKLPSKSTIKPNMYTMISINDKNIDKAIVVSENIVQNDSKGPFIYVLKEVAGVQRAEKRYIEKGMTYNGQIQITKGLDAGDKFVSFGYQTIVDGQALAIN